MTNDLDRAKSLLTRLREHVGFNSDGMMSSDGSYRSASKRYDLLRLEAADMIESLLSAPPSAGQEPVVFSRPNPALAFAKENAKSEFECAKKTHTFTPPAPHVAEQVVRKDPYFDTGIDWAAS